MSSEDATKMASAAQNNQVVDNAVDQPTNDPVPEPEPEPESEPQSQQVEGGANAETETQAQTEADGEGEGEGEGEDEGEEEEEKEELDTYHPYRVYKGLEIGKNKFGNTNPFELSVTVLAEIFSLENKLAKNPDDWKAQTLLDAYRTLLVGEGKTLSLEKVCTTIYQDWVANRDEEHMDVTVRGLRYRKSRDEEFVPRVHIDRRDFDRPLGSTTMMHLFVGMRFYLDRVLRGVFRRDTEPKEWEAGSARYRLSRRSPPRTSLSFSQHVEMLLKQHRLLSQLTDGLEEVDNVLSHIRTRSKREREERKLRSKDWRHNKSKGRNNQKGGDSKKGSQKGSQKETQKGSEGGQAPEKASASEEPSKPKPRKAVAHKPAKPYNLKKLAEGESQWSKTLPDVKKVAEKTEKTGEDTKDSEGTEAESGSESTEEEKPQGVVRFRRKKKGSKDSKGSKGQKNKSQSGGGKDGKGGWQKVQSKKARERSQNQNRNRGGKRDWGPDRR